MSVAHLLQKIVGGRASAPTPRYKALPTDDDAIEEAIAELIGQGMEDLLPPLFFFAHLTHPF